MPRGHNLTMSTIEIQTAQRSSARGLYSPDVEVEALLDLQYCSAMENLDSHEGAPLLDILVPLVAAAGADCLHDSSENRLLFKVPAAQRRANPEAFEPFLFFFGPYQYAALASNSARAAASLDGEHLKRQVAMAVLEEGQLQELAHKIQHHLYSEIKDMYPQMTSEQWGDISMEQFAEKMALDAVTVVATWYIFSGIKAAAFRVPNHHPYCNIAAFSVTLANMLIKDAFLLENQVPLNVLRYAFKSLKHPSSNPSFETVVIRSNCNYMAASYFPDHQLRWPNRIRKSSDCLLGAIYDSLTPSQDDEDPQVQLDQFNEMQNSDQYSCLLTASHLARYGIGCRAARVLNQRPNVRHGGRFSCTFNFTEKDKAPELPPATSFMSAINFNEKEKVIELPRITVGDDTLRFLHNLLAYEASCRFPKERFVGSYCNFMDHLINTQEDVQILVQAGVIRNLLGSHGELAASWNKLGKCVSLCSTLKDHKIVLQVDKLVKSQWHRLWKPCIFIFIMIMVVQSILITILIN